MAAQRIQHLGDFRLVPPARGFVPPARGFVHGETKSREGGTALIHLHLSRLCPLLLGVVILLTRGLPAHAAPSQQDDPAAQCAAGDQLFLEGQAAEALPLLEAGFAHREQATFADLDALGKCALALGILRNQAGNRSGALEAYQVALNTFQTGGNRKLEGTTLNNIGEVYRAQGRYAEALDSYQQTLVILREIGDRAGEGTIFNNIGLVHEAQGRYVEALNSLHQALAIHREVGNQLMEGTTLNNIGEVYRAQGRYAEALSSFQQALVIVRELGQRALEGASHNNIGAIYKVQGRYADALNSFQQALAIAREVGDRAAEGSILANIGFVYQAQGQYTEALENYQQALAIHREVGDRAGEGTTLANIGLVYDAQGRHAEALESYQQALAIAREVGDRAGEGDALNSLGLLYAAQGRHAEALDSYQQVLAIRREVGDRDGEGSTLHNIGMVYKVQGRYAEALDNLQQALSILREVGDRAAGGAALGNIGLVYQDQGRYVEALDSLQQSLAILSEVGDRAGEGTTLANIGSVYWAQGQSAEALDSLQQALAIAREVGDRAGEGTTLINIGSVYWAQGQSAEALDSYQQALTIFRELGDRAGEGLILNNIGEVYRTQGRSTEALDSFRQAIAVFETIRSSAGSEAGRAGFIAQHISTYQAVVDLLHQQGQDEAAFFASEQGRARAFLDSLATGQVQLADDAAAELLAQEQELYVRRQALQDKLAQARAAQPPEPEPVAELEAQLADVETAYAQIQADIQARPGQLADLAPGRSQNVLGVPQVQPLLDEQTTLVSYFVLKDKTLAFLVTRHSFQTLVLEVSRQELEGRIRELRDFASLDEAHPQSAVTLYDWLIQPLKPYLTTPHLAIIPNGVLHYLPFAALSDGQRDLIDDYTLTSLPNASALPFIQENANSTADHRPQTALILGNPVTGDYDATAALATERGGLGALPFAEQEAKAIAALYGVQPLIGAAATESALRTEAAQAGFIHLAAHGVYNPAAPLSSLIALAPDEPATGSGQNPSTGSGQAANDGWLTVGEVYGLDLSHTDLVVLSACQTNLGELSAGDEVVGLTRAFIFAGAPSVIASLWNVEDQATALLMERFYTHLRDGMGKAQALRQAQLEIRAEYPNPYYWAGFVLSGDGGPTQADQGAEEPVGQVPQAAQATPAPGPGVQVQEGQPVEEIRPWSMASVVGALLVVILLVGGAVLWRRMRRRHSTRELQENERQWEERG